MSVTLSPVVNTQSFGTLLARVNQTIAVLSTNAITTDTSLTGGITTGNGTVNGIFGSAQTLFTTGDLRGGNISSSNTLNISSNASFNQGSNNIVIISSNSTTSNLVINLSTISINASANSLISANNLTLNTTNGVFNGTNLFVNANFTVTGTTKFNSNSSFSQITINPTALTIVANGTTTTLNSNTYVNGSILSVSANTSLNNNLIVNNNINVI